MKWMQAFHRTYRAMYRANRATRTVSALSSGNPRRVGKLYARRVAYKLFGRWINRVLR